MKGFRAGKKWEGVHENWKLDRVYMYATEQGYKYAAHGNTTVYSVNKLIET